MKRLDLETIGRFLEKLAEKSESVYWLSSPDLRRIQYISPAYEKIWGRSRDVLYAKPETWITYIHPEDVKNYHPIHEMAKKIIEQGSDARYEENYRIQRPDGEIRWIIDRGFPIYDDAGNCCGVTGVAIDITREKQFEEVLWAAKEEAEAANKAKTEFLENIRHDIRTPLTGIIGFSNFIQKENDLSKIKEYALALQQSSEALFQFLNRILESINVASGQIPILKKKFNLATALDEVVKLNAAKAKEKQLNLEFKHDCAIPQYLLGDSTRIYRIALELLANALNYTHQGKIILSTKLAKKENNRIVIKLIVEDTGIGIPVEKQQEIFLRFKRLTPAYAGIYQGTGLGLTIVRQYIDDLGAEIYVESQTDKGSIFTCIIPLQEALLTEEFRIDQYAYSEDQLKLSSLTLGLSKVLNGPRRILVVEDHLITADITKTILSNLNCEEDIANNGATAMTQIQNNSYDLIFMDIGLPDIDGCEVTQQIRLRELTKNEAHTPIIGLTAHIDTQNRKRCIDAGMNTVITKPLVQEKFEDILNII